MAILDAYGNPIETRATTKNPTDWLVEAFGGGTTSTAGERVSPRVAMTVMTFFACVRNISEDMAKLPKKARQKQGRDTSDLDAHPVTRLMRRPNPYIDAQTHWETFQAHALTEHGGYCEIVRNGAGDPVEVYLLDPSKITVVRNDWTGEIAYRHADLPGRQAFRQSEILHLHGLGWDGATGYRISDLAREVLGAAVAMQKYRGSFFGNGANPSGVLTHPATLGDKAAENLRRQFQSRYSGANNSFSVITLEEGMSWVPISTNPDDSQSVELEAVTITDICRAFRMPPHKVQHLDNAHYANIEQDNINYATDTLDPWRARWKSEIEFKLFREAELDAGVYLDINMKALMRGDAAARTAFYRELFYMGAISANDILELEDENPVEYGDRRFMQANLIPTDRVDDVLDKQTEPAHTAPDSPNPNSDAPGGTPDPAQRAFMSVLESKIAGILRVESDKAKRGKINDDFWESHRGHLRAHLGDIVSAVVDGVGSDADGIALTDQYIAYHISRSQTETLTPKAIQARAKNAAAHIMESILCTAA